MVCWESGWERRFTHCLPGIISILWVLPSEAEDFHETNSSKAFEGLLHEIHQEFLLGQLHDLLGQLKVTLVNITSN